MNNSTIILQSRIKSIIGGLAFICAMGIESYERYWGTNANTDIGGLADGDAVTVTSALTKAEFIAGITMAEAIKNFFRNSAVVNSAYIQTARKLTLGNNARASILSKEVESIGSMLSDLGANMIELRKQSRDAIDLYLSSEISAAVAGMSNQTVIFGADVTKSLVISGVTLLEQYLKLCDGNSPTQGDYKATIAAWSSV